MRVAAIDIGTNTILMLIAEQVDGAMRLVRDEHAIARMGRRVDRQRRILPESFDRVEGVLRSYLEICRSERCDTVLAVGTSALRDAENREDFLDYMRTKLGISVRILSGDEEARLSYRGAVSALPKEPALQRRVVLDIGGGSTELIEGTGEEVLTARSTNVGSVRLSERFLSNLPPTAAALEQATREVDTALSFVKPMESDRLCIGVAGTLTTLASIDLGLARFDRERVDGHTLERSRIEQIFEKLLPLSLAEVLAIPQILPQRADIILAGVLILRIFMDRAGLRSIRVSDRGLRHGLALEAFGS